jgi:hypothetical protein
MRTLSRDVVMSMNRIARTCLLLTAAAALASCGAETAERPSGGQPGSAATDQTTTSTSTSNETSSATTTTTAPMMETRGTEQPGPTKNVGIAISLPGLPAGGQSDDTTVVHQCMAVSWLGDNDIPDGVSVFVTGAQVTPSGLFDWGTGGSDCGSPRCTAPFAFTSKTTRCVLPVTAKGANGSGELLLTGEARCGPGHEQKCRDLVAHERPQTLPLIQPTGPDETTTDPPTPTS